MLPIMPALLNATVAVPAAGDPLVLFVAMDGNDAWSGQLEAPGDGDGPFATLARAARAVAEARAAGDGQDRAIRVFVRGGCYALDAPLVLTAAHSGTAEHPTTFAAYRDEHPEISGGRAITGWEQGELNGHAVWAAALPEVQAGGWNFRQLWVNGERRERPRFPKEGFYWFTGFGDQPADAPWNEGGRQMKVVPGAVDPGWRNLPDVEIVAFTRWIDCRLPIERLEGDLVTFTKPSVFKLEDTKQGGPARYWVENVAEALDRP
ncbi:MAG: hypothetical protein FJX74_11365, partial [Armatimonadetes bacterium]|nr:hypothetical protein [Armatimonadota bacterium]